MPKKPSIIIAQVEGSGTAAVKAPAATRTRSPIGKSNEVSREKIPQGVGIKIRGGDSENSKIKRSMLRSRRTVAADHVNAVIICPVGRWHLMSLPPRRWRGLRR